MNEDEKLGLKKRPKIDVGIDPEDDEPIGSIFKLKKPRNPKRGTDGSSGNGNANKVETRAKKTVLDDQDFGNMNDTLASFRKKLRGPKKDSGSVIMMGHHSVLNASEQSAHFPIDSPNCGDFDVKSSSEKVFKGPVIGDDGSDATMVEQSKYRSKGRYRKSKAASLPKENIDSAKIDVVQDYLESRFTLSQNQRAGGESSDHCSDETLEDSLSAFVRKAQSGLIRKTSSSSKPRKGLTSENGLISAGVSDDSKLARVRKSQSSCGLKQVYELPKPANNLHSVCGIIPVDVAPNQSVVLENEMSVDGFCEVSECTRDKLLSADQFDGASLVPLVKDDRCFRSSEAILKDSVAPTLPINSECGSICSKDAEKFIDGKSDKQGKVSQTGLPVEPCVQVEGNGSAPISRITLETQSLKDGLAPCSMGIASSTGHDFVETPSSPKQVEEDKGEFFRTNDNTIHQQSKNGLTAPNIMEQNLCFTLGNEINVLCNSPCGSAYEDSCKQSSEKNFGEHSRFQSQNLSAVDSPKKEETCSSCDGQNQFRDTNKEDRHLASPAMLFHADHESDFAGDIIQLKKSLRTEDNLNKLSQEIDSDEFTTSVLKCHSDFPQNQSYEGASKGIIGPANDYNSMNEEANEVSSLSVTPDRNQGYLEDAGSVPEPEIKNNKIPVVQRAVRRAKKRRHGDMAYEGDSDWEHEQGFLESHQFIGHDQSSKMRDRSDSLSTDAEAESGGLAAVAAGLKARAAGPVEKIKFKEILKRRGGLQEYLECRNRILGLWSQDVSHILLPTDCGVSDTPSENEIPHDSLIREVYKFLDHRGYINVGIASKRKKGEPNGTHNYKLLRERSFAKNSGIPGVDSDDGVFFILGREKGYEACKEAKNGVVFDEVNQTSEPTKGEVLVALKTSELSSLAEPEEGSADDSQENGCVDAKLPTTENGYVDAKVATTTSNLDALNLDPSSEVPDSEIIPGRAPDFKNCFHSVQCSSTAHIEQNYDIQQSSDARKRIIVIGAGPAGLTAARHLQRQGFSVDVLEARSRIGGRVFTDRSSLSVPVDLGASIITGVEADVATERRPDPSSLICAQLGLELTVLNSDCPLYDILTGEKVPSVLDETLEAEYNSLLDDMVLLVAHEGEHSMRMSLEDGLEYALKKRRLSRSGANYEGTELHISEDNSVATKEIVDGQIVERNKHEEEILSPLERRVMDWHFANLEYGCAALLQEVSLPYWNQDDIYGGFGGAHCMIKGGYSSVVESIGEGLHIHLNHVVTNVSYGTKETGMTGDQCSKVKVSTSNGNEFSGDAVLITVPLGCLKAETIKFSPPLPQWKNSSIQRLGFGVLNKVALEFPEVFWDDSVDYFGATAEETRLRGQCFMFWNVKKTVGAPVLIALVVGKAAIEGQYMNMADHVKHAVMVLRKLFGEGSVPDPVASVVTDWGKDPFSYGAYSYVAVGASGEDYDMLGRPVENCLFFAGEATCKEHPDTVGGAMISGLREAVRMIDILNTGNDYVAEVEAVEATQKHSDSERNEVRDIVKRLDAVELSNVLYNPPVDRSQILSRKKLLQDLFCSAKTTAGRLHLAKELLKLPVEALKSFAGTKKGLGILNSWILDSMGKDGTQLLRHCVRILVLVSSDLLAVRLSGVGKTVKEKVCVHTSRDIRAIASQLVSMWIEVFRKEKASNGGRKFLKQAAAVDSSKSRSAKELASGKPPLRMHHVAPENQASLQFSASARSHSPSKSNFKKVDAKPIKLENMADTKSEINSSTQGSAGGMDLEGEVDRRTNMSDEEKVAFAAAEAARAAARAAAEAYASSEAKCSTLLQLPKIPSFHKFARREQYAQMDEFDFKRKWAGGILGRQDCLSEIDSRNCRVRNWSVDFSAACVNLDSSRVSVDNLSQRSHSNELACQFGLREHSGESMAADSSMFTKAWVDTAGSVKDYHAVERWQSQAAAADLLHSTTHIRDEEDSNTISRQPSLNLDQIANEGSFTRLTINKDLTGNQTRGAERIKRAVVDYVASLLMPLYKAKKIDKEGYKSIMKKTATKVMEQTTDAEKGMSVPEFLDFKRKNKIRSFVDKLIERHMVKPVVEH